jgi:hypothetical protein
MEKPHVNRVTEKGVTKHGINIIIGIHMDDKLQLMLRYRIMAKLSDIWELPLTNDWNGVLDCAMLVAGENNHEPTHPNSRASELYSYCTRC